MSVQGRKDEIKLPEISEGKKSASEYWREISGNGETPATGRDSLC